jgi:cullin-associated NEDD8-dissociated protein 1
MKATLDFKIRSNAVKQEIEKNQELVRATVRCVVSLSDLAEKGKPYQRLSHQISSIEIEFFFICIVFSFQIGNSPKFEQFVEEVQSGPHAEEYKAAVLEVSKRESRIGDYMDLSS